MVVWKVSSVQPRGEHISYAFNNASLAHVQLHFARRSNKAARSDVSAWDQWNAAYKYSLIRIAHQCLLIPGGQPAVANWIFCFTTQQKRSHFSIWSRVAWTLASGVRSRSLSVQFRCARLQEGRRQPRPAINDQANSIFCNTFTVFRLVRNNNSSTSKVPLEPRGINLYMRCRKGNAVCCPRLRWSPSVCYWISRSKFRDCLQSRNSKLNLENKDMNKKTVSRSQTLAS